MALARSLIKRPRVLLLDEPLAALDKKLRGETQFELMELQRRLGTSFVIVTHDQEEAMIVADRMAVMREGRVAQVGAACRNLRAAEFALGRRFHRRGDADRGAARRGRRDARPRLDLCALRPAAPSAQKRWLALRPEKLRMSAEKPAADGHNALSGTVAEIGYRGDVSIYKVRLADRTLMKVALANSSGIAALRA